MSDQNVQVTEMAGVAHTPPRGPQKQSSHLTLPSVCCFLEGSAFHLERMLAPAHTEQPVCILIAPANKGISLKEKKKISEPSNVYFIFKVTGSFKKQRLHLGPEMPLESF